MSKSLGNFRTLPDLLETIDPRTYRLLVLRARYRSPLEATDDLFAAEAVALERIDSLARRFGDRPLVDSIEATELRQRFIDVMDDDLDTPTALGHLFDALRRANALADAGEEEKGTALAEMVLELFRAIGLQPDGAVTAVDSSVLDLVADMDEARTNGDYGQADLIRKQLEAQGFVVENTPNGTRVRR
jgi:cysteinyl-tRNA synthetase